MLVHQHNALIVDDEFISRRIVGKALGEEGFHCVYAADGDEAMQRIRDEPFDLVVTDLRMPKKNGHSLAVELLALDVRPVIVVHSCVDNPAMTKDLILRGVDDIIYKPANYEAFAAKVAALVNRRATLPAGASASSTASVAHQPNAASIDETSSASSNSGQINREAFDHRLTDLERQVPLSPVAYEVYVLANDTETTMAKIVDTMTKDPVLSVDILTLANSAHYNRNIHKSLTLKEAVSRIGFKNVGVAALAQSALGALRGNEVPWMDTELEQARSIAAGAALQHLCRGRDLQPIEGLTLCAYLHPLGRFVLGTVFKDEYSSLLRRCTERNESLIDLEREMFPGCYDAALERLLSKWGLPDEIWKPLCHVSDSYESLAKLDENIRIRVEMLKLANFVGNLAVGRWMRWDHIEPPPAELLIRHQIADLPHLVEQTGVDMKRFSDARNSSTTSGSCEQPTIVPPISHRIAYCNVSGAGRDWMPQLLASLGVHTVSYDPKNRHDNQNIAVNCLNAIAPAVSKAFNHKLFKSLSADFWVQKTCLPGSPKESTVLQFPTSVASLQAKCRQLSLASGKPSRPAC